MTEQEKNVMRQALESLKNLASDLGKIEDEVPSIAALEGIIDQQSTSLDEYELRGMLAGLKCWPRLTGEEAADLVRFAVTGGLLNQADQKHHRFSLGLFTADEPLFWYRPRSDGYYEGPIHNAQLEKIRKESGAWHPLYTRAQHAAHWMPIELCGVAETIKEGAGFWRSCTGCHELNEGYDTGPFSKIFECALGNGCDECGGIGAIWDNCDYEDMANYIASTLEQPATQPPRFPTMLRKMWSGGEVQAWIDENWNGRKI